jgi:hypothetical protein
MKVYRYITGRNKGSISIGKLKKELAKEVGLKCYFCNGEKGSMHQLELEHKIPVELGGKIFDKSNLGLSCIRCHKDKTKVDLRIIRTLKTLGVLWGSYDLHSLLTLKELEEFYPKYYPLALVAKDIQEDWNLKEEYVMVNENRGVGDGEE